MTLLPLLLSDPASFALAPAQIGAIFAAQSAVSVLGAAPAAWLADRVGPAHVIAPAIATSAIAIAAFPHAADLPQACAVLLVCSAHR